MGRPAITQPWLVVRWLRCQGTDTRVHGVIPITIRGPADAFRNYIGARHGASGADANTRHRSALR